MQTSEMTELQERTHFHLNRATVLLAEGKLRAATVAWELAYATGELINEVRAPAPCVLISVHDIHGIAVSAFTGASGATSDTGEVATV